MPGGFRYKSPFPEAGAARPQAGGKPGQVSRQAAAGAAARFLTPEDLLLDEAGRPQRIDKAFRWDAPLSAHGLMHMVIANAGQGDPYPIDALFMYMANMAGTRR